MRVKIEIVNKKLHLLSSITRHDILNTLTAIIGYLSCVEDEIDPGHLNIFIKKSYQIALLIKELIEFTRYYQDIWVIEPIWQNTMAVFTIATNNIKMGNVAVDTDLEYFRVFADPFLDGLIYNLIVKYLKYGQNVILISSYWFKKEMVLFGLLRIMD